MYRECKECKERMMIINEGYPKYAHGSYIIYGCPSCGNMEYEYDPSNCDGNTIKLHYSATDVNQYYVSN